MGPWSKRNIILKEWIQRANTSCLNPATSPGQTCELPPSSAYNLLGIAALVYPPLKPLLISRIPFLFTHQKLCWLFHTLVSFICCHLQDMILGKTASQPITIFQLNFIILVNISRENQSSYGQDPHSTLIYLMM